MLHKAVSPEDTVQNIRSILHQHKIFTIENWFRNDGLPPSVRVDVHNIPMGTNGKGRNCLYALASGYAEFLERLQNLNLFDESNFKGNQKVEPLSHSDSKKYDFAFFRDNYRNILSSLVCHTGLGSVEKLFTENDLDELEGVEFLSLTSGRTIILPRLLVDISLGSNGMCAGNSAPEAIMQGLSEIYERHVLHTIHYSPGTHLPVIPDKLLKDTSQWQFIERIRSCGYQVFVKDCSIGGYFPVIGVLLIKGEKALFNLGSAQNFSIALERCITEILQGLHLGQIDGVMNPITQLETPVDEKIFSTPEKQYDYQYYKNLICGQGVVPPVVFDHDCKFDESHLFHSNDLASEDACKIMLNYAKDLGYEVYCRDVSFLGFDTYRIYVPGISEVMRPSLDTIENLLVNLPKARKTFFNLPTAKHEDILDLANTIENLNDTPLLQKERVIPTVAGLTFNSDTALYDMSPENVLALLYYSIGEFGKAHETLNAYLIGSANSLIPGDIEYAASFFTSNDNSKNIHNYLIAKFPDQTCLSHLFRSLDSKNSIDNAISKLRSTFPDDTVNGILSMLTDEDGILSYLNIPKCGDDCDQCAYVDICCFPDWRKLTSDIKRLIEDTNHSPLNNLHRLVIQ